MRIAILSPISWRTPPRHYGPWELFASLLTEGLVAQGHDVTLFATADSITAGRLHATLARGWSEAPGVDTKVAECTHIASLFERAGDFDVLHNGFDFLPLTYASLVDTPMVTTIHGFSSPAIVDVYERYDATSTYVSISDADRHPRLHYAATVHHGLDLAALPPGDAPGEHLVFFGRIHPDKGAADAIAVARAADRRLVIAGIVHDEAYFRDEVAPHVDGDRVRFIGPVAAEDRAEVLGGAHALLHLIHFDEPFGFSVAEALACGTPVVAHRRGSMPELVADGRDGFLVDADVQAAADAVAKVGRLDRAAISRRAHARFDRGRMVAEYERVYREVLGDQPSSPGSPT